MALPKINKLEFPLTLPLSKQQVSFRQYTVEDEKLLLSASGGKESDPEFYVKNTLKVIRGCINDTEGLLEKLPAVDVEYLLLHIRAKSVGESVEVKYKDPETGKVDKLSFDLEKFTVEVPEGHQYKIELTDKVGLTMRDLRFAEKIAYAAKFNEENQTDMIFDTIVDCIESIYDEERVYVVGQDATREEVYQFVMNLAGASSKLYEFIATLPQIVTTIKLPNGQEKKFTSTEIDFLASSPAT